MGMANAENIRANENSLLENNFFGKTNVTNK
jgi:hypothetical protein